MNKNENKSLEKLSSFEVLHKNDLVVLGGRLELEPYEGGDSTVESQKKDSESADIRHDQDLF